MFERKEFRVSWVRAFVVWCREVDRIGSFDQLFVVKRRLERLLVERYLERGSGRVVLGYEDYDRCVELGISLAGIERGVLARGVLWRGGAPERARVQGVTGVLGVGLVGTTGLQGYIGVTGIQGVTGLVQLNSRYEQERRVEQVKHEPKVNRRIHWIAGVEPVHVEQVVNNDPNMQVQVQRSICGSQFGACIHTRVPVQGGGIVEANVIDIDYLGDSDNE